VPARFLGRPSADARTLGLDKKKFVDSFAARYDKSKRKKFPKPILAKLKEARLATEGSAIAGN